MNGQVGKSGVTRGTQGVTQGKKRGRNGHHQGESEGEEAVHACSVTAHDLYKGMGNLYMTSRNFGIAMNILSFASIYVNHMHVSLCNRISVYALCEVTKR